jgi:hypothetical protein
MPARPRATPVPCSAPNALGLSEFIYVATWSGPVSLGTVVRQAAHRPLTFRHRRLRQAVLGWWSSAGGPRVRCARTGTSG